MLKNLLTIVAIIGAIFITTAQISSVSGTVVSANGKPIADATVLFRKHFLWYNDK